jgi:hypothetical protein
LTRTTLLSAVFNDSAWTIYRAGVKALCLSSGELVSAADETAATEPNAIEIAETNWRIRITSSRCPEVFSDSVWRRI